MEIQQCRFNSSNACGCKKNVSGKCLCPKRDCSSIKKLCARYKEKECPLWNYNTVSMSHIQNPFTEKDLEWFRNLI
jgi:hypothetical protein